MRVSIVSTGEEILRGEVLDTNAAFASELLDDAGFAMGRRYTCGDAQEELTATLAAALAEADAVICCGGLGPTSDDRTAEAAAEVAGVDLITDPDLLSELKEKFAAYGLPFTDNQARQAQLPAGAEAVPNPRGTAAGIACRIGQVRLYCLPGPPREFRPMLEQDILPRLLHARAELAEQSHAAVRVLRTFGRGEGALADAVGDLEAEVPHLELGYRAAMPEIHVKLRARRPTRAEAEAVLDRAEALVRERLGVVVFGRGQQGVAAATLALLQERDLTLAAAESCTGGLVGKLLTDVPGASASFLMSAVTYANQAKQAILGVPAEVIAEHGAVSEACALAMAEGARARSGADLAVAVTGIAGPDGGTEDKPVGTVWFATAGPDGTRSKLRTFPPFDRESLRRLAAHAAIDLIRRRLLADGG